LDAQRVAYGKREGPPAPIIKGLWDWQEAKAAFIVEVRRTKREATYVDYRNMLGTAELTRFDGREMGKIALQDMAIAVEAVHRRGV
jgi:hypothetical protein